MFSSQGWLDARMEDIAAQAGVSPATAYNHFPTKQALVGHVYAPLVLPQLEQAQHDIAAGRAMTESLKDQGNVLAQIVFANRRLSAALWAAAQDYTIRVAGPAAPDETLDPLVQAPLAEPVRVLVEHGQRTGELRPYPTALEVSRLVVDLVLLRCVDIGQTSAASTTELLLTVTMGALRPELLTDSGQAGRPFESTQNAVGLPIW
jgi:AcrR family transcriptional regulator